MNDIYKRAIDKELKWLEEDIAICKEQIKKIENGENVGYTEHEIRQRMYRAMDEQARIHIYLTEAINDDIKSNWIVHQ